MKKQISSKIESVSNSYPSIWTKDDVVRLLTDLNDELESEPAKPETKDVVFTRDMIISLSENIMNSIDDMGTDILDDYELYLSGREVEVDSISLNNDSLKSIIREEITDFVKQLEETQEEEEN
jgi:hypothetical protein